MVTVYKAGGFWGGSGVVCSDCRWGWAVQKPEVGNVVNDEWWGEAGGWDGLGKVCCVNCWWNWDNEVDDVVDSDCNFRRSMSLQEIDFFFSCIACKIITKCDNFICVRILHLTWKLRENASKIILISISFKWRNHI